MSAMPEMKMPNPWFTANQFSRPISMGWNAEYVDRPLATGERRLGSFVLPPFQRESVWTPEQKVRLIESLWGGLPIGGYVVNRVWSQPGHKADGWLLDGQQRWTAILDYQQGKFEVGGYRFTELDPIEQRRFSHVTMVEMETSLTDVEKCKDLYERLAYGGTAHPTKTLDLDEPELTGPRI
jgi:hypothetical protein